MWSTSYNYYLYKIEGIFTDGGRYWLTRDGYTGAGFTIKLSTCKLIIVGVHVKNIAHRTTPSHNPSRATKSFRVSFWRDVGRRWKQLLEEDFENPLTVGAPEPTIQSFYFKEAVEVQYLRFYLDSFWGRYGGGLDYFSVITVSGNLSLISILVFAKNYLREVVKNQNDFFTVRLTA